MTTPNWSLKLVKQARQECLARQVQSDFALDHSESDDVTERHFLHQLLGHGSAQRKNPQFESQSSHDEGEEPLSESPHVCYVTALDGESVRRRSDSWTDC